MKGTATAGMTKRLTKVVVITIMAIGDNDLIQQLG